jgi:cell division protein FtsL
MRSSFVERITPLKSRVLHQVRSKVRSRLTTGTIVLFSAALIVAGMYLAISMRVARIGREMISLETQKQMLERSNNELAARLAIETSPQQLWQRAKALGYRSVKPQEMEYLVVSGYQEMDPFTAPLPVSAVEDGEALISPAFTESLIDWFGRWMGTESN